MFTRALWIILLAAAPAFAAAEEPAAPPAKIGRAALVYAPSRPAPAERVSLRFMGADIDDVLRFLADATGKPVYREPEVRTAMWLRNQERIPVADAVRLVRTVLSLKGFTLTETKDALIAVRQPPPAR